MSRRAHLPDGRRLDLAPEIGDRLSCGAVALMAVSMADGPGLAAEMAALEASLRGQYAGCEPSQVPGLREARDLYRSFGMDPSRHRPSSEALLRRVLQGKGLYRLGGPVDACNLASLSFLLPIGLYDLAKVRGDILVRPGLPGDGYAGIRKDEVHVGGRLALYDDLGPFGSPTSDSLRTSVEAASRDLLAVVMATGAYPRAAMEQDLDLVSDLYVRHCRAAPAWRAWLGPEGTA